MEWEDVGRVVGKFFLAFLEYSFKLCAVVAAGITIGTKGTFADKITNGFDSLSLTLRQMLDVPGKLMEMGTLVHDFNTQPADVFTSTYGVGATNNLLLTLNRVIEYFIGVYENFSRSPLVTATAMLLIFLTFYLLAWVLRFTRQNGRGSFLVRLERKLAEKTFNRDSSPAASPSTSTPSLNVGKTRKKPAGKSIPGSGVKMSFSKTQKPRAGAGSKRAPKIRKKPGSSSRGKPKNSKGKTVKRQDDNVAHDSDSLSHLLKAARSS